MKPRRITAAPFFLAGCLASAPKSSLEVDPYAGHHEEIEQQRQAAMSPATSTTDAQWWCFWSPSTDYGFCEPTHTACAEALVAVIAERTSSTDRCTEQAVAFCFDYAIPQAATSKMSCHPSAEDCAVGRRILAKKDSGVVVNEQCSEVAREHIGIQEEWWCFQEAGSSLSGCGPSPEGCAELVEIQRENLTSEVACAKQSSAHCVVVANRADSTGFTACYPSVSDCKSWRAAFDSNGYDAAECVEHAY